MAYKIKGVEPAINRTLAEIEMESGPDNLLGVMAHRPEAIHDFTLFHNALLGSPALLDRRLREMVYLAVSFVNESSYDTTHHTRSALAASISRTEIREIEVENNQHFIPKEQAALHYARELTRTASAGDDTRYRAQELFSVDEFVELTMIVGLANFTNRFSNALALAGEVSRSAG